MSEAKPNGAPNEPTSTPGTTPVIDRLPRGMRPIPRPAAGRPPRPAARVPKQPPPRRPLNIKTLLIPLGVIAGLIALSLGGLVVVNALRSNNCDEFSTARTSVTLDALTIGVRPDALNGRFGVKLNKIPLAEFTAGSSNADVKAAAAALPAAIKPVSAFYNIATCNTDPKMATVRLSLPADLSASDTLDLYSWDGNARAWRWIGGGVEELTRSVVVQVARVPQSIVLAQVAANVPIVGAEAAPGPGGAAPSFATELYPFGLYLGESGMLTGDRSQVAAAAAGAKAIPTLRNWNDKGEINRTLLRDMLATEGTREAHIRNVASLADTGGYAGVEIDYRGVDAASSAGFTNFVTGLGAALKAKNKSLSIVIPAPERTASVDPATMWNSVGYNARALADVADSVKLDLSANPAAFGEDQLPALMDWALARINRSKLQVIVPAGSQRVSATGEVSPMSQEDALAPLGTFSPEQAVTGPLQAGSKVKFRLSGGIDPRAIQFDAATQSYRYALADASGAATVVYLSTPSTLGRRLNALQPFNLRGVTVRGMTLPADPAVAAALAAYQKNVPAEATAGGLSVAFLVKTPGGSVLPTKASLDNPTFEWTVPDKPGAYTIASAIESGASSVGRGSIAVEVAAPPTPTPAPSPTPAPTRVVVAAAPAAPAAPAGPAPTAAPAAPKPTAVPAAPPVGGGMTGFGIGAHVNTSNNLGGYLPKMAGIGMTWAKVQIVMGGGAPDISGLKAQLNGNGIKLLVGAIGDRNRFSNLAYHKEFAAALASLARQGAEAIEVWNEPNLDREVGGSNVSPQVYANMLREAYIAIKAANPNTIVVGGAAAPTGYFGSCTAAGCNDQPFLEGVAAAGGTAYMDCQGAHYNGSPNPPSMTSGGPTGDHYSWYFYGTLNTTFAAIGGKKPICFTELGYVTLQDQGRPMPPGFEWGGNITLQNQADWIADAMSRARASGKVTMVIVWNANFHNFDGNDPQVGYSIFRPNGSCPACDTIRRVMGR